MEVLMPNYVMNNIQSFSLERVLEGIVIWVLHADKIPPHIGISINGLFFSLKANGKDIAVPIENVLDVINRREITLLCFSLSDVLSEKRVADSFELYDKTIPNKITCLNPIKNILKHDRPTKLVELLSLLEEEGRIINVFGLNILNDFSGIKDYDVADIHERLTLLDK